MLKVAVRRLTRTIRGEKSMKVRSHVAGRIFAGVASIAVAALGAPAAGHAQTAANGALDVPARSVPVPTTVSPQMAKIIGLPLRTDWNLLPKTGEEWKPVADGGAVGTIKNVPGMME